MRELESSKKDEKLLENHSAIQHITPRIRLFPPRNWLSGRQRFSASAAAGRRANSCSHELPAQGIRPNNQPNVCRLSGARSFAARGEHVAAAVSRHLNAPRCCDFLSLSHCDSHCHRSCHSRIGWEEREFPSDSGLIVVTWSVDIGGGAGAAGAPNTVELYQESVLYLEKPQLVYIKRRLLRVLCCGLELISCNVVPRPLIQPAVRCACPQRPKHIRHKRALKRFAVPPFAIALTFAIVFYSHDAWRALRQSRGC